MKAFYQRLGKLLWGLMLYALGIIVTIHAEIGYAPWDVFQVGLAKTLGISLGMASIAVGMVVVLICALLKETMGLGTLLNMLLIGTFMDLIIKWNLVPQATTLTVGIPMFILGMAIIALATYFYISSGFGAGPRDSLMVAFTRFGWSIAASRTAMEFTVTLVGYFLGGKVGLGTVLFVLLIGWFVQVAFQLFGFDAKTIHHESLKETFRRLSSDASG